MEIKARVALSLPSTFYKIVLKYDTFEKASYDSYLVASLVLNSKDKNEAYNYIDEITGKGSLNSHFKNLYEEISELSEVQLQDIIDNSLFPITIVDRKNNFKYYPMFNVTRMNNKVYNGNLKEKQELLESLIMPKGERVKFLSMEFEEEPAKINTDNYYAKFSDEGIKVDLDNNQYYSISKNDFLSVYKNDVENISGYLGKIQSKITEGNWNVLSKITVDSLLKDDFRYQDSEGNHTTLYNDYIKTTEIIKVFDLYFYKETRYNFLTKNCEKCADAIDYLIQTKKINEYKTKSLIGLLLCVDDKKAQNAIQYVLERKDSKEISEVGMKLIKDGLEKGWEHDVLQSIKKQVCSSDYKYLYRLDNNLDFDIEDILLIDDTDLSEDDKIRKQKYLSKKENMLKKINQWIGEMTSSGLREKIKKISKSDLKDRVKKFLDVRIGHNKKDYKSMNLNQLSKEYEEIEKMYNGDFQKMLKEVEKLSDL